MDFKGLLYFEAIARHGNLTRASEELYISQSALSKHLQKMEEDVGIPLFQYVNKKMQLTYAGKRYLAYTQKLLSLKNEMDNEMLDIQKKGTGLLRVGMPPFRISFALPAVLPAFRKTYPNIEVSFLEANSDNLDRALFSGEIDLAFYNLSTPEPGLCYETIHQEQVFAVLPKDHPVSAKAVTLPDGKKAIHLGDLKEETFLLQNRSQRIGQYIRHELSAAHIVPKKIVDTSNIRAGISLAACGYGVAFASGDLLRHFEYSFEYDAYPLVDCDAPIRIVAAWRENGYVSLHMKEFIRLMKEA